MRIADVVDTVLSLPNTLRVNFKYFKFSDAIKLPIKVSRNVILKELNGTLKVEAKLKRGMIKIGYGNIDIFDKNKSKSIFKNNGNIVFNGSSIIGHGVKINVNKNAELILGDKFGITAESSIICNKKITFGDGCLVSWNCLFMDTDFHRIYNYQGEITNLDEEIVIEDNVWIGCGCTILKGIHIGQGSVIAANSNVTKSFINEECIIGGNPARVVKEKISWKM